MPAQRSNEFTAIGLERVREKLVFGLGTLRIASKITILPDMKTKLNLEIAASLRNIDRIDATILKLRNLTLNDTFQRGIDKK